MRNRFQSIVAIVSAVILSLMPALSSAGGNFIGPIYSNNDTTIITFPLVTASSATQALYSGATFPAGECKVSVGGATFANCTNTPSELATTSGVYQLSLSAAEMSAASGDTIVKISKGSAYEDLVILVKTQIVAETLTLVSDRNIPLNIESTDTDFSHPAVYINRAGSTAGGDGILISANACGSGNCDGIRIQAGEAGAGINVTGGNSAGPGLLVQGGSSGNGITTSGGSGNTHGIASTGQGTGHGWIVTGGTTGNGILAQGGATSGSGIYAQAQAGNSIGLRAVGFGTGAGINATAGATGIGFIATGDTGARYVSNTANGVGFKITGTGTGTALDIVGGTGYAMAATGGTHGIYASGSSHGIQGSPDIYPVTLGTSVWAEVTGTEPSAGPTWGTSTYGQFMSMLVARFYNKVTQTATTQSIYKTGGVTVMATGTVTDDGVTQTKGEQR